MVIHNHCQRELMQSTVLNVAYSGSGGYFLPTGIGRGIYFNQRAGAASGEARLQGALGHGGYTV